MIGHHCTISMSPTTLSSFDDWDHSKLNCFLFELILVRQGLNRMCHKSKRLKTSKWGPCLLDIDKWVLFDICIIISSKEALSLYKYFLILVIFDNKLIFFVSHMWHLTCDRSKILQVIFELLHLWKLWCIHFTVLHINTCRC